MYTPQGFPHRPEIGALDMLSLVKPVESKGIQGNSRDIRNVPQAADTQGNRLASSFLDMEAFSLLVRSLNQELRRRRRGSKKVAKANETDGTQRISCDRIPRWRTAGTCILPGQSTCPILVWEQEAGGSSPPAPTGDAAAGPVLGV